MNTFKLLGAVGVVCAVWCTVLWAGDMPGYQSKVKLVNQQRLAMSRVFEQASTAEEQSVILNRAGDAIINAITKQLTPHWYGTKWSFNGTSDKPREGSIACGYFVTTILEHADFKLDRFALAQLPSEAMIRTLISREYIKRYSNHLPIDEFLQEVVSWGSGLYIVGLDDHTGFLLCVDNAVFFIHSSPDWPMKVVREPANQNPRLINSGYRVLGKLSADEHLLAKWLGNREFRSQP